MRRVTSLLASVFLVAGWALPGLAQGIEGREFHGHYGWGYGHMFFGGLMVILFWAGIIVLVVLAVRWFGGGDRTGLERPSGRQSALEILQERYARGEIDHDEFERRKQLLTE